MYWVLLLLLAAGIEVDITSDYDLQTGARCPVALTVLQCALVASGGWPAGRVAGSWRSDRRLLLVWRFAGDLQS